MKITYNWLKNFVGINIPALSLADKLTMAGLEVVSIEEKQGDFVLEIEITSNRPDWLSLLGIAREVSVLTNKKLKLPAHPKDNQFSREKEFSLEITDKKDCPFYHARIIKGLNVVASPDWIREKLELIGCRSVNNIVDITNYVLFEMGQPMHAFDLDKITGKKIFVRRARSGEKIITIDNNERILNKDILIIADEVKPLAIAGIMGGRESEVTDKTENILLETAVFNPILVRRARQALGLQSESSYRFERGVDLCLAQKASLRSAQLIAEVCHAERSTCRSVGRKFIRERNILLWFSSVERVLGINVEPEKMKRILSGLGFVVSNRGKNAFLVGVPSFRQDVKIEQDLIEEIARIYGYQKIPVSLPKVPVSVTPNRRGCLVSILKNSLTGLGLSEAITYSLTDNRPLSEQDASLEVVELMNPLSQEQGYLRASLLPGLIRSAAYNFNQKQDYVCLFEVANVFIRTQDYPVERLNLGIVLSGEKKVLLKDNTIRDELGIYHLKGVIEKTFWRMGVNECIFTQGQQGKTSIYSGKEMLGEILILKGGAAERFGIKNKAVLAAEINLEKLFSRASLGRSYVPAPKYPSIVRDISFIINKDTSIEKIISLLKEKGLPLLRDVQVTDYYQGRQIPQGHRGLTLSFIYGSNERTLVEEEVSPLDALIRDTLISTFGVKIR